MNVESESKRSVNRIARIDGSSASLIAPRMSSARNADEKSGALVNRSGRVASPSAHASAVTEKIAARNASGFCRRISAAATRMPSSRNAAR